MQNNNGYQNFNSMPANGYWGNAMRTTGQFPITQQQPMNPNYGGYMQTPQQPVTPYIYGRVVASEEEITIRDVPNDGTAGFYPLANGSAVYMKQWNNNGTISMIRYIPDPSQFGEQQDETMKTNDFMASIEKRFDKLEAMIRKNSFRKSQKLQNEEVNSDESNS